MFEEEWASVTGKCPLETGLNLQKEAALMQQVIYMFIYRCNLPCTSKKVHRPLKCNAISLLEPTIQTDAKLK